MYIYPSDWQVSSDGLKSVWSYNDNVFECQIKGNGPSLGFSWYANAQGHRDHCPCAEIAGEHAATLDDAKALIEAFIECMLKSEFGDYAKRMAGMPKCPHCGAQVGYHAEGIAGTVESFQEDITIDLTLNGTHITRLSNTSAEDFKLVDTINEPGHLWCLSCKHEITDENFIDSLYFGRKHG